MGLMHTLKGGDTGDSNEGGDAGDLFLPDRGRTGAFVQKSDPARMIGVFRWGERTFFNEA